MERNANIEQQMREHLNEDAKALQKETSQLKKKQDQNESQINELQLKKRNKKMGSGC